MTAVSKHPPATPKAQLSDSYTTLHTPNTVQSISYTPASVQGIPFTPKTKLQFSSSEKSDSNDKILNLISQPLVK